MSITYNGNSKTFHLTNGMVSYIMKVLPNEQLGQLYFGKAVQVKGNYDYLLEPAYRSMAAYTFEGDMSFSLEHIRQEYPSMGTGDFRHPAVMVREENGSMISDFRYKEYSVTQGKPGLEGLPATYCDDASEAETLHIVLEDPVTKTEIELLYTIFTDKPVMARSSRFVNNGEKAVYLENAMSVSLDLPDSEYDWIQLSGAWSRERHIRTRRLEAGVTGIESTRGNSSHYQNPFVVLKRPTADEFQGEAIGFSLIYSGTFLAQAEVDAWDVTRFTMGINPFNFEWKLEPSESFRTPEAVIVYSENGMNKMSQTFHELYRSRLARGYWRDKERPILINCWETLGFDISEDKAVAFAAKAREQGVEMFVLDDGWFGDRTDDTKGLGDWHRVRDCLPNGIKGLSDRIKELGMQFGLWIEPEMVNRDSDLFRMHPDWAFRGKNRRMTHGRNQYVLDYGRKEVVDHIYEVLAGVLSGSGISYVKWDMNRSITEAFSAVLPADRQGEVLHRYILGVYDLYERLTAAFPEILFESCSSGGGRFDPGMLYYAPQCWTSDDTDALERLKIQYGTSMCYPISSMGAHVSVVPNQQTFRNTPIRTRANVAMFGTFGYELDLNEIPEEDLAQVPAQVAFMKKYRRILQFGTFYRLVSPFENNRAAAWMVVSEDKKTAIAGWYKILNEVNGPFARVKLRGLDENAQYRISCPDADFTNEAHEGVLSRYPIDGAVLGGDELMRIGLVTTDSASGECRNGMKPSCDFDSRIYVLQAE